MTTKVLLELLKVNNPVEGYVLKVLGDGSVVAVPAGVDNQQVIQNKDDIATLNMALGGLAIDIVAITSVHVTHAVTQWSASAWTVTPLPIADAAEVLLLGVVDNAADKNSAVTTVFDELNITQHPTSLKDVIKTKYYGGTTKHQIRLNMNITAGNAQHYAVQLCRASDDSVVATYPVSRNQDTQAVSVDMLTFTYTVADPYVTDGFYIKMINNSGLAAELSGTYSLTIFSDYQYLNPVT